MAKRVLSWQAALDQAVQGIIAEYHLSGAHFAETSERVISAWEEYLHGYESNPADFLTKKFDRHNYDEMVHVKDIRVMSLCAHHFAPIVGKAHFAYIPGGYIVGLSKISRLIDAYAARLQIQEMLTQQIVDTFQTVVKPRGCAVYIRAYHFCMLHRGVQEPASYTETTALRGCFKTRPDTKQEFLSSIDRSQQIFP